LSADSPPVLLISDHTEVDGIENALRSVNAQTREPDCKIVIAEAGSPRTRPGVFAAIVLVALAAGTTLGAAPSQAGSQPYSAERVCGAGYKQIDRVSLGSAGTTYLLYNAGNANNCVVTLKATSIGTATSAGAYLQVAGQAKATVNSGQFKYYAGPVRAPAANKCVKWGGWHGTARRDMPSGHCGATPSPKPSPKPATPTSSFPPSVTLRDDYPYMHRSPSGVDPWRFYFRECTSFVAFRLNKVMRFSNTMRGGRFSNAKNWDNNARRLGYRIDANATVGSVMVRNSGKWGHVAIVAKVEPGRVYVEQYNTGGKHRYSQKWLPRNGKVFIHFKQ
jgi:surface antigen